jgi:tripartite ATP-independent transporter DctP family solute receptor
MKRVIISVLVLTAVLSGITGCGSDKSSSVLVAAEKTYKVVFGTHMPPGSTTVNANQKLIDSMTEKTNGRFQVTLAQSGQLGSQRDIVEACNLGSIQFAMAESGLLSSYSVDDYRVFSLPYLFTNYEHFKKTRDGAPGQAVRKAFEDKTNMVVLSTASAGFRSCYLKKPVRSFAEMKGLKIRTPENPVFVKTFTALGSNPTPVPANEMYSAIQTGVVDGMESINETIISYKINEVTSYCVMGATSFSGQSGGGDEVAD